MKSHIKFESDLLKTNRDIASQSRIIFTDDYMVGRENVWEGKRVSNRT